MSLVDYAKFELARIEDQDDPMQQEMNSNIVAIVDLFAKQGHSGFTAAYLLGRVERLMRFLPLTPLTGEDSEWVNVYGDIYQNRRRSSVFRTGLDNSTAHDIEGKIFSSDGGETWFQNSDGWVTVVFPYMPPMNPERILLEDKIEPNIR